MFGSSCLVMSNPVRAVVVEDSPEEESTVLIEFWDNDDAASRVDKATVRKIL